MAEPRSAQDARHVLRLLAKHRLQERPWPASVRVAVEVDLVAAEPLQLVGVKRFTERLFPDQRAVGQLLFPGSRTKASPRPSRNRRSPSTSAVAGS